MEKRINWYRTPIDKAVLKGLTERNDFRGIVQAGSQLLIYIGTVYFSYYFFAQRMWVAMVAACYVHCFFHSFLGMEASVHELSHNTAIKTKWINNFFYYLFCFLTWNNPIHFRPSHMNHHQYTLHDGLDKEVILEKITFTRWDYISWFFFDFNWFKTIMGPNLAHLLGRADVDFFNWDPLFSPDDERRKKMVNWARFMFAGHVMLLGVFIYFQLWVLIVVVTLGYFFVSFGTRGCVIQQHLGLRSNVPDWRVTCHTVIFGPLMRYLYWNMNYHVEHHMFAAVPFYNLRKLHKAIAYDTGEPMRGYLRGIRTIVRILKKQREDPSYFYTPTFPSTAQAPKIPA